MKRKTKPSREPLDERIMIRISRSKLEKLQQLAVEYDPPLATCQLARKFIEEGVTRRRLKSKPTKS